MLRRSPIKKRSLRKLPTLKREAENRFHQFIRLRDCLKTTKTFHQGKCYTCEQIKPYTELEAGHFRHNKLDFDEMNLHAQCTYCNHFMRGNLGLYAIHLVKDYGTDKVDDLVFRSHQINKYDRTKLEEIIQTYKQKVIDLIGK